MDEDQRPGLAPRGLASPRVNQFTHRRLSGRAPHLAGNGPERPLAGAELTPEGQAGRAELHMPSALFCSVVLNPGRA